MTFPLVVLTWGSVEPLHARNMRRSRFNEEEEVTRDSERASSEGRGGGAWSQVRHQRRHVLQVALARQRRHRLSAEDGWSWLANCTRGGRFPLMESSPQHFRVNSFGGFARQRRAQTRLGWSESAYVMLTAEVGVLSALLFESRITVVISGSYE